MAKNLMGVGFNFTADSKGVQRSVDKARDSLGRFTKKGEEGFGDVTTKAEETCFKINNCLVKGLVAAGKAIYNFGKRAVGALADFGGGVLSAGLQLAKWLINPFGALKDVAGGIGGFFKDTFQGMGGLLETITTKGSNLTSDLERDVVTTGKSLREILANMGFTGKQLDSLISKGFAMGKALAVGPEEAAGALRAWTEAESELRALGLNSAEDVAKFTSAFHVNADLLRDNALQMRKEMKLSDEQINRIFGSTVKFGQASGNVQAALEGIPELLANMRKQASQTGQNLGAEKLADFAAQTNAVAAAVFQVTQKSEDAASIAKTLSGALVDADLSFNKMFTGVETELPEFHKELAISLGSVTEAFDIMRTGPAGFVQGMAQMVKEAKKNGEITDQQWQFLGHRIEKILGDQAGPALMNFFKNADTGALDMMSSVQLATADLGKLGKEVFRTGRSMQDEFNLVIERLEDNFRSLGRPAAREWLAQMQKELLPMGKQLKRLGEEDGLLGSVAKKMSELAIIGGQALVPKALRPTTMFMSTMLDQMGPAIEVLGKLGVNFTSLSGIISAAGLGLATFATRVMMTKGETESWGDAIGRVADEFSIGLADGIKEAGEFMLIASQQFKGFINSLFGGEEAKGEKTPLERAIARIRDAFNTEEWQETWANLKSGFMTLWDEVSAAFVELWRSDTVQGAVTSIKSTIISIFEEIPWEKIGALLWEGIKSGIVGGGGMAAEMLFGSDKTVTGEKKTSRRGFRLSESEEVRMPLMQDMTGGLGLAMGQGRRRQEAPMLNLFGGSAPKATLEAAQKAEEAFMSLGDAGTGAILSIEEEGNRVFGNSIHDVIQGDMDQAVEVFRSSSLQINEILSGLYFNMEQNMMGVLENVRLSTQDLVANLQDVLSMQTLMESTQATVATSVADLQRDAEIAKLTKDDAVHQPLWYVGSKGYERLFKQKMDQLITAIGALEVRTQQARQPATPARNGALPPPSRGRTVSGPGA